MKTFALLCMALLASLPAMAADGAIAPEQMGLSKTGVWAHPEPIAFDYPTVSPYGGGVLPRAFEGAPPMIPHRIEGLVPITRESNMCASCHRRPEAVGKDKIKGLPTAMPGSHYTDVRNNAMHMGRYNCTQCHTPQVDVKSLVDNTFKPR